MRRFLYLNHDSIYSYISQIFDGLPTTFSNNIIETEEKEKDYESGLSGDLDVRAKILGNGSGVGIDASVSQNNKQSQSKQYINSLDKKIYDEAFEKLTKHLEDNLLIKTKDLGIGDFLQLKSEMFIVDLQYYKTIFSDDTILEVLKKNDVEKKVAERAAKIEVTGNGEKAKYDLEKINREVIKEIDKEYIETRKMIDLILNIVPYNKFGIMGDYLIVLDDEYFRDKTKVVAYKYGGQMTMLGYLTNVVNSNIKQTDENIFTTFPTIINSFMLAFFNKEEIKIVHPVAIYY